MSGNSLAMGVALGRQEWPIVREPRLAHPGLPPGKPAGLPRAHTGAAPGDALALCHRLWPGSAVSAGVSGTGRPGPGGRDHSSLCFGKLCGYVVLLTLAMGLQTATVGRAAGQGVRTTFVTGVLSDWA